MPDNNHETYAAPARAPGPVVAGAIVFGGLYSLLGFASALSVATKGGSLVVVVGACAVGAVAFVVGWYLWRGRAWAHAAAIILSIVGVLAFFVPAAGEGAGTITRAISGPALILAAVIGCLVIPQSSRVWFYERG